MIWPYEAVDLSSDWIGLNLKPVIRNSVSTQQCRVSAAVAQFSSGENILCIHAQTTNFSSQMVKTKATRL